MNSILDSYKKDYKKIYIIPYFHSTPSSLHLPSSARSYHLKYCHLPLFAFKIDLGSRCPFQNYRGYKCDQQNQIFDIVELQHRKYMNATITTHYVEQLQYLLTVRLLFRCGIIRRIIPLRNQPLIYTFISVRHKTTMNHSLCQSQYFIFHLAVFHNRQRYKCQLNFELVLDYSWSILQIH